MSYPQRPPMGMSMPGGMQFGYAPMGMMGMPMNRNMIPMMRPVMQPMPPHPMMQQMPPRPPIRNIVPEVRPKVEKPPVTTVFVGNITERAPDPLIKTLLQSCGNVLSWKRVLGGTGKLQAFGFCEYEDPESTLRCIRLLNEWPIADKNLVVTCDGKTKKLLDEHNNKKKLKREKQAAEKKKKEENKKEEEKEEGETHSSGDEDEPQLDAHGLREDHLTKVLLEATMKEYDRELKKELPVVLPAAAVNGGEKKENVTAKPPMANNTSASKKNPVLTHLNLGEGTEDLIGREIRIFRDKNNDEATKRSEREIQRDKDNEEQERERRRDREERLRRDDEHVREKECERAREKERDERSRKKDKDREKERERDREKERERERERSGIKSRSHTRDRSTDRTRDRDNGHVDDDETYERRRMERRLREKEAAYQECLKKWETRERQKARKYEKDKAYEAKKKAEEAKEAKRLTEFLEDYRNDRDDAKYYKGSALQRRLNDREKEMESDERDRRKERVELDEIRQRLLEDGHPDPEAEMAKIERQREEHLMPRLARSPEQSYNPISTPVRRPDDSDDDIVILDDRQEEVEEMEEEERPLSFLPDRIHANLPHNPRTRDFSNTSSNSPQNIESDDDGNSGHLGQILGDGGRDHFSQRGADGGRGHFSQREADGGRDHFTQRGTDGERGHFGQRDVDRERFAEDAIVQKGVVAREPLPTMMSDDSASGISNNYVGASTTTARDDASQTKLGFGGLKFGSSDSPTPTSAAAAANTAANAAASAAALKRKKLSAAEVFNTEDEDVSVVKKRKLVPITYTQEEQQAVMPPLSVAAASKPVTAEEKRKSIKNLIERIPTAKDELFAYELDWNMVDATLMDRRIKPWVNKKIMEYIGEDEPSLSDFICTKVISNSTPSAILSDIGMVLDDEAEVFVVKMWRLLIYETEAKKLGLVK